VPLVPRYFFHIHDGRDSPDQEGVHLPDLHAVRPEAIRAASEMLRDLDGALTGEEWTIKVTDQASQPVLTLRFSATEHAHYPIPRHRH
jgi:hypothetical protein